MTPPTQELTELLERVRRAEGPDRELDTALWLYMTPGATRRAVEVPANKFRKGWTIDETRDASRKLIIVPEYTASIDAAVGVVERMLPGSDWQICKGGEATLIAHGCPPTDCSGVPGYDGKAKTPPLSILAALLQALISQQEQSHG